MTNAFGSPVTVVSELQARFLAVLPRIERHARIFFRWVRCWQQREDRVAETIGLAWKWFRRLAERGRDARQFVGVLARYAARAVATGRRLCGQECSRDVLSPSLQQRRGFSIHRLPDYSTLRSHPVAEALQDNTRTEVPEQVAFRCDFPVWRASRTVRDQQIMDALLIGEQAQRVAARFGLSVGRISQKRREFAEDWARFIDPGTEDDEAATPSEAVGSP
jgi:hypothetical protein